MNTNISSLQTIVGALQQNDYVTGVAPVMKNGETIGYTITFSKSSPITIYCNENDNGADGHTPVIGVRQDTDGIYYWTLDGDWLTDESGNKVKAEGRDGADGQDGQDGVTPQLKIEGGDWYVSTDNGATWTNLGKATGKDGKDGKDGADSGDSIFQSITQDDENIYFALKNGETIVLPKKQQLTITFAEGNSLQFDVNEAKTVNYTITGGGASNVVKAEMQNSDDAYTLSTTPTSATEGMIKITAKFPTTNNVIVSVSDGSQTVMTAIAVSKKPSPQEITITVTTPGTLSQLLADYDKTKITELTIIGNLNDEDIAILKNLPYLAILDMEYVNLEALPFQPFKEKSSLTSVKLPKILKTIEDYEFRDCSSLRSITIPDSVTSIGGSAFRSCNSLTSVTIGNSVTSIGVNAFYGCSGLTSVTIGNSVTSIGVNAFYGCSGLTSVTIGNSVTSIGGWAFDGCSGLTAIYCKAKTPPSIGDYAFSGVSTMLTLYVPIGSAYAYRAAKGWNDFTNICEMEFE